MASTHRGQSFINVQKAKAIFSYVSRGMKQNPAAKPWQTVQTKGAKGFDWLFQSNRPVASTAGAGAHAARAIAIGCRNSRKGWNTITSQVESRKFRGVRAL
eukprot:1177910-Prorocentrum_minimum.AAC.3